MKKLFIVVSLLFSISFFQCTSLSAQETESIQWLSFEQLEDSLAKHPKKVFIDFHTDWCTYCRKMDKVVFTKPQVVKMLNENYYAVRFDAETESEITFGGQKLVNNQLGKSRTPIHQIAQLLASRGGQFAPPVLVMLDEKFKVTARYFHNMDSKKLLAALKK